MGSGHAARHGGKGCRRCCDRQRGWGRSECRRIVLSNARQQAGHQARLLKSLLVLALLATAAFARQRCLFISVDGLDQLYLANLTR